MNITNNKILFKQFYYRYYNKYQCAIYLGLSGIADSASIAMKIIENAIVTNQSAEIESFVNLLPLKLKRDFYEFVSYGKIESEQQIDNLIPDWIHGLIKYSFVDGKTLAYIVTKYDCKSLEDLIVALESEENETDSIFWDRIRFFKSSMEDLIKDKTLVDSECKNIIPVLNVYGIKGLLHNHTILSDGLLLLSDYIEICRVFGLEYIGISDHSVLSLSGITENELFKQLDIIEEINSSINGARLLKGIECEIAYDGNLDIKTDIANMLDYLIVGVHRYRSLSFKEANSMLIRAIENPLTDVLAHPCSRTLNSHPGLMIDVKKIIDACIANNVVIELNLSEKRIDLPLKYVDYALNKGAKFLISTDTHKMEHFNRLNNAQIYPLLNIPNEAIINTLDCDSMIKFFQNLHNIKRWTR